MNDFEAAIRTVLADIRKVLSDYLDAPQPAPQNVLLSGDVWAIPDPNATHEPNETLSADASPAVDVGMEPANSTYVPISTDQDPAACTDLDRTYLGTQGGGESEGRGADTKFILAPPTPPKPRPDKFNPLLFAEFWTAYPRKVGRLAAIKAFTRIEPSRALVDTMIEAVEAQGRSDDWRRGFIPHASTWLNGARWEDELDPIDTVSPGPRRAALARAVGPVAAGGTWRDRCTHDPECQTPLRCEVRRRLEAEAQATTGGDAA